MGPDITIATVLFAVQQSTSNARMEIPNSPPLGPLIRFLITFKINSIPPYSFTKATIAATKTFGPALLEDVIRTYIEDPDSFKFESPTNNTTTANDDNKSMVDRLVEGRLFKEHDVEVKNLKSEDNGDKATVTVTIQNNKKNMTKDIKVLMRHLGDGTWVIYDIPDIEDLYTITRK